VVPARHPSKSSGKFDSLGTRTPRRPARKTPDPSAPREPGGLIRPASEDPTPVPGSVEHIRPEWLDGIPFARAAAAAAVAFAHADTALADMELTDPRKPNPDADTLRRLYLDEGLTAKEVAARIGMTEKAVSNRLRRAGINRNRTPQAVTDQTVRALYEDGLSIRAIAAELGMHQRSVWRHLGQAGVELRPRGKPGVELSRRQLEQLYVRDGLSLAEVARRFEVDPHAVARNLDRYGIPRRRPTLDRAVLEELYVQQRLGIRAIAERLGVSQGQVRGGLDQHGIGIRRPGRPGSS
jgi:transposase-like protein